MMIPSTLPKFEIPSGLMPTGLQGLRGFGRGLGQVDVGALAQAFQSGQINPTYGPSVTSPSAFGPSVNPTYWPSSYFPDEGTANQIAALLGGMVVSLPVEDAGGVLDVPTDYWVQTPEGSVRVSDIIQAGNLSSASLCSIEQNLANAIPGGQMDASCGGSVEVPPAGPAIVPTLTTPLPVGAGSTLAPGSYVGVVQTPTPVTSTPVQNTPTSTPVSTASPTGSTLPPFSASDTCATVQTKIALYQANGQSNVAIWNQIPAALAFCPSVQALNPQSSVYNTQGAGTSQPGTQETGSQNTSGTTGNTTPATTTDNTMLYVGIGIAALVLVMAVSK
jgi:hypothetical protein